MRRITVADLQSVICRLNALTNNPTEEFTKDARAFNTGCYVLYGAYGGYCLQQRVASGGVRTVISGFVSKRELHDKINAYISGVLSREVTV